jgi:unsaturated chondroitin disaccharide hydrolase
MVIMNIKNNNSLPTKSKTVAKYLSVLAIFSLFLFAFKLNNRERAFIRNNFVLANQHLKNMLEDTKDLKNAFPRTAYDSKLYNTKIYEWTTGFFPGTLWYAYEYSNDEQLKEAANVWTEKLRPLQYYTGNHDLGFMMYCSYGNAYRLTGSLDTDKKDVLVQSAKSLASRYNATAGVIKSWNSFRSWHGNKTYYYPVIIDNMMNLELLFFASKVTGDDSFRQIAMTHALSTIKNQIREDYSSYHVVAYDSTNGQVIGKETAQGYADNSTWARGQAWGIYGFTMCYRETKDERFLKTAQGMADFFIEHKNLPKDKIPYWDFNANEEGYTPGVKSNANKITAKYRDASAAAITASALLELSTYSGKNGKKYRTAAQQMLHSLASPAYRATVGTNGNFILTQSVGSIPHNNEINVPLVYADYYFLEALIRYDRLLKGEDLLVKKMTPEP